MSKTILLMSALVALFMYVGDALGGTQGMQAAFIAAVGMNVFSYFFSDKLVLNQYRAIKATQKTAPELYRIVSGLALKAGLPMPQVYIIDEQTPNAFATGRSPDHAAVAATKGLLNLLTLKEIEAVLAHEMSHIKHRDILISTIASVFAGAIVMLSDMTRIRMTNARSNTRSNTGILAAFLLPIAATIIRMAISRTREYKADEGAAYLTNHPEWLMGALQKLDGYASANLIQRATPQTAHMFIVNPFLKIKGLAHLFSTHPSTENRLKALAKLQEKMRS